MRRDAEPTPQQPMRVWPIREQPGNDNPHRLLRRKAEDVLPTLQHHLQTAETLAKQK